MLSFPILANTPKFPTNNNLLLKFIPGFLCIHQLLFTSSSIIHSVQTILIETIPCRTGISKVKSQLYLYSHTKYYYSLNMLLLFRIILMKEKGVPMSSKKSLQYSVVQCFLKVIILVSIIIVLLVHNNNSIILLMLNCMVVTQLTSYAWRILIYTHLILISMLKNDKYCLLFVITITTDLISLFSFTLPCFAFRIYTFINSINFIIVNFYKTVKCKICVIQCDIVGKQNLPYKNIFCIQFKEDLFRKISKFIFPIHLSFKMALHPIILNFQSVFSKQNYWHLKIIKHAFSIRSYNQKLPPIKIHTTMSLSRVLICS